MALVQPNGTGVWGAGAPQEKDGAVGLLQEFGRVLTPALLADFEQTPGTSPALWSLSHNTCPLSPLSVQMGPGQPGAVTFPRQGCS